MHAEVLEKQRSDNPKLAPNRGNPWPRKTPAKDDVRGAYLSLPIEPSARDQSSPRCRRSSPARTRIAMVGAVAMVTMASAVRPVARATPGAASARAAHSARVSAVVPGVSSRGSPLLTRRPVRGRRVVVGERKKRDSEGPLDTVEIEECLQVRTPSHLPTPAGWLFFISPRDERRRDQHATCASDRPTGWCGGPREASLPARHGVVLVPV